MKMKPPFDKKRRLVVPEKSLRRDMALKYDNSSDVVVLNLNWVVLFGLFLCFLSFAIDKTDLTPNDIVYSLNTHSETINQNMEVTYTSETTSTGDLIVSLKIMKESNPNVFQQTFTLLLMATVGIWIAAAYSVMFIQTTTNRNETEELSISVV